MMGHPIINILGLEQAKVSIHDSLVDRFVNIGTRCFAFENYKEKEKVVAIFITSSL